MRRSLIALLMTLCMIVAIANPTPVMAADNKEPITLTVYIVGEDQPFQVSIKPNEYIGNIKLYLQSQTDVDLNTLDLMHDNGHSNRILLETKNFYHYNIKDGQTITTQVSKNWNYDVVNGVENTTFTIARPIESGLTVVNANAQFGMSPDNYSNHTEFQAAMNYCKDNPGTKLVINPGVYHFRGMSKDFALDNLENILIDAQNSEFIFDSQYCFKLTACSGVEFKNLIIDWDWDSSRIGSIVKIENVSPHNFDVRFLELDDVPEDIPFSSFILYDEDELIPGSHGEYRGYSPIEDKEAIRKKEKIAPNVFHIEHNGHMYMFQEGDVYILRHYVYSGRVFDTVHYSKNITFNNVKIYSFSGMGWVFADKTNHFQIINSYLGLRPGMEDSRRISAAADAIHVVNSGGYFRIDNNDLSFNGDDIINVHDDVFIIKGISDDRTELTGWVTGGFASVGEKIGFKNSQMGEFTDYEATVTYSERDSDTYDATIRLAEPLPSNILTGYYAYNASTNSSNYVITNNYIHETKGRIALLYADNALFANNYIYRNVSSGVQVRAVVTTGRWTGGIGTSNVYIQNNIFEECDWGSRGPVITVEISLDGKSPDENIMNNINIENNTFISCITDNAIDVKNVESNELKITGNTLINSGTINTNNILSPEQVSSTNTVTSESHASHNYIPVAGTYKHKCTSCPSERYHDFFVSGAIKTNIEKCSLCQAPNPYYVAPVVPDPTPEPTAEPTANPTVVPTTAPTVVPTEEPTLAPTTKPTTKPSVAPTTAPTVAPTNAPSATPVPTVVSTVTPSVAPTKAPEITAKPTEVPAVIDKPVPTDKPSANPTVTAVPTVTTPVESTVTPTVAPTKNPTAAPTVSPTTMPTDNTTNKPSIEPTDVPSSTNKPSDKPVVEGKPTAVPTNEVTATPTAEPTEEPTVEPPKAPSVEDFAERLYTTCLGRDAEEDGKAYWTSELKSGKTGAEVAEGFFFSPEYEGRKLNNKEFIGTLYETFMDRTPADEEVAYWASEMKSGKTRKDIFDGFVNSPEWADICLTYGIRSGGLAKPTFEKEASPAVKAFAERLYTTCLGREAEIEGLEWWAAELANLRQTGTVAASGFFYSPEFIGLKTSDSEYITRLYKTFMGRSPEEAGFKFWIGELKSGKDRQYVFDGFSGAPEFAEICSEAGILR